MELRRDRRKKKKNLLKILKNLKKEILSQSFLELGRASDKFFTRKGKVQFHELILFQISSKKGSLQSELDKYLKLIKNKGSYTKQAYSEARKKILPSSYKYLNEKVVLEYYKDNEYKKHNGYRILAVDGSILRLPNTQKLKETFGEITSQSKITLAAARISVLYDVENKLIIDAEIDKYKSSERDITLRHMEKLKKHLNSSSKELIIFDRGYPSLKLFINLLKNDVNFLMRVSGSSLTEIKEFKKSGKREEILKIKLTKARIRRGGLKELVTEGVDEIELRVLRVVLDSGEVEILITSLMDRTEFSYGEFKKLYFKRWGVEIKYDDIKNIIEIENFTGLTPEAIEQDFHATILISNLESLIESVAQIKIEEENLKKAKMYDYQINKNLSHGKYKDNIVRLLRANQGMGNILNKTIEEIEKNTTPIREGRSYPRETKYRNKYPMNQKKAG